MTNSLRSKNACFSLVFLIAFTLFAAANALAQKGLQDVLSAAKFNGTWVVDEDYVKTRGEQNWTVSFTGNEFKINKVFYLNGRQTVRDLTLFIDKRGETNHTSRYDGASDEIKSKTSFKDGKITRQYMRKYDNLRSEASFLHPYPQTVVTEVYYLSKDGNKLVQKITDDSWPNNIPAPSGQKPGEFKTIFRRKS